MNFLKNLLFATLIFTAWGAVFAQTNNTPVQAELNLTLGEQRVRFAPTRSFQEMRLEVTNSVGEVVFTYTTNEAQFDWNLRMSNDEPLPPGLYAYRLALKFGEEQSTMHSGHFIVEKGQDQIWLTASEGAEVSGTSLNAARMNGRALAGFSKSETPATRDVKGRELIEENNTKPANKAAASKQEKSSLTGTANFIAKFGPSGNADTDSGLSEDAAGRVGIRNTAPPAPLSFEPITGNKISLWNTGAYSYGMGIQPALLQIYTGTNLEDVAIGHGNGIGSAGFAENMRIKGNGRVGIRNANPPAPLSFESATGNKISLWNSGTYSYGIGVQPALLQIYSASASEDVAIGHGNSNGSAGFVERMRIKGTGNVGLGTTNPVGRLNVVGSEGPGRGVQIDNREIKFRGDGNSHFSIFANRIPGLLTIEDTSSNFNVNTPGTVALAVEGITGNVGIGINSLLGSYFAKLVAVSTGNNSGVRGDNDAEGNGVLGRNTGGGSGVYGANTSFGPGVQGYSENGYGVKGTSNTSTAIYGKSTGASGKGIYGEAHSGLVPMGVHGFSMKGPGVFGENTSSTRNANFGSPGIYGKGFAEDGVWAISTQANGIYATGGNNAGYFDGHVYISGNLTVDGTFSNPSDLRLKQKITGLGYGLREVMQLRPVTWQWKDKPDRDRQLGLIAQEVQLILPELVVEGRDEVRTLSLNYTGLVPVMLKAIQEQQTTIEHRDIEIKTIKTENALLKERQTELAARLTALEQALQQLLGQQDQTRSARR